ncbi:uncharacterized protein proca1 [Colossoma macropomum]|uniref:uncharacterized protein proca1 n=1 Tax=Colossoma macropomum TaxID=42526 RepID=UPI001863BCE3|nr:uncharacterized protein proca1 [Colossoma macropomum]
MWSVFFLFLSYLDRDFVKGELVGHPLDADKESNVVFHALGDSLCARSSTIGEYSLHQVSDGVEDVRSVRSPAGQLVQCSVTANLTQVTSFMRACRLGLREQRVEPAGSALKLTDVAEARANCHQLNSKDAARVSAHAQKQEELQPGVDEAGGEQKLRRNKRGFTYPGTLWCGAGNIADDYDQLGEFTETDKCCRTHDHCPHVIHAFSSSYGYTNFKWHSISHCDCDNALKQCLREVNDTSSRVVGQAFFNVIEVPCFEFSFEEQCVERHWYGVCKRYDRMPVAVIRQSIPYDFGGIDVIDVLTLAPPKKKVSELDKDEQEKTPGSESTTQSTFTGSKGATPEEPSLTNVVTAAEDFIKVLATVSTSQSSSADSSKGEAQTSEKKRKKNAGKKKKDSKKRRGKGKGKKRKQNAERVSKTEEGVAGAPSANRTEEVINKNHFVEDPRVIKNNDNFMTGAFDSVADGGHSNKMMRDEYQRMPSESQMSSTTTTPNAKQEEEMQKPQKQIKNLDSALAVHPTTVPSKPRSARLRQRAERKRHGHLTPTSLPSEATLHNRIGDKSPVRATESTSPAGQTTQSPISPAGEEAPRSLEYQGEKGSAFIATTQNTPIVGTKRLRSRQRGGRKKSRKLSTPSSPIEREVPHALKAEGPLFLATDVIQELTVGPSHEPQGVSERLRPNRLENPAEHSASSPTSGKDLPKKRHQRLKGTRDRRRPALAISDPSTQEDTRLEDTMTTSATTIRALTDIDSQRLLQTKNPEASTGHFFLPIQTSTPPTLPLKTNTTKGRRSKERADKKRRKSKVAET